MEIYFAFVSFEEWLRDLCFGNTKRRWSAVKQKSKPCRYWTRLVDCSETLVLDFGSRLQRNGSEEAMNIGQGQLIAVKQKCKVRQ